MSECIYVCMYICMYVWQLFVHGQAAGAVAGNPGRDSGGRNPAHRVHLRIRRPGGLPQTRYTMCMYVYFNEWRSDRVLVRMYVCMYVGVEEWRSGGV